MARVFVDANVLFSAAYKTGSPLRLIWGADADVVTSDYALAEAKRNLLARRREALPRLEALIECTRVISEVEQECSTSDRGSGSSRAASGSPGGLRLPGTERSRPPLRLSDPATTRTVPPIRDPKDRPILIAAIAVRATFLVTQDLDFAPLFGRRVEGVLVLRPADYLRRK